MRSTKGIFIIIICLLQSTPDIDECSAGNSNNCSIDASCMNIDGGFSCICMTGYSGDGFSCTGKKKHYMSLVGMQLSTPDVDECVGTNNCSVKASCANTDGSFSCTCYPGYTGDGTTCTGEGIQYLFDSIVHYCFNELTDFNECGTASNCDVNADCANTDGSYTCSCSSGYSGDGMSCTGKKQLYINTNFICFNSW